MKCSGLCIPWSMVVVSSSHGTQCIVSLSFFFFFFFFFFLLSPAPVSCGCYGKWSGASEPACEKGRRCWRS